MDKHLREVLGTLTKMQVKELNNDEAWRDLYEIQEFIQGQNRALREIRRRELNGIKLNPKQYLGKFKMSSASMIVTDPCYDTNTWCQHKLNNVKVGDWYSYVTKSDEDDWGIRVSSIVAYIEEPMEHKWKKVEGVDIGVDSGQAGFFDGAHFKGAEEDEAMYEMVCNLTSTSLQGGVISYGAVSSSGYGDGGYNLYVVENDGEVVATKIVFIGDDEEVEY